MSLLTGIFNSSTENAPSLLGPVVHSGILFYLIIFIIILLGAVFIITPVPENTVLFLAMLLAFTLLILVLIRYGVRRLLVGRLGVAQARNEESC